MHKRPNEIPFLERMAFPFLLSIMLVVTDLFVQFGVASLMWAGIYGGVLVFLVYDHSRYLHRITAYWPVLLLPLFAIISTYWSEVPNRTFITAIQLLFTTLIGIWVSSRFSRKDLFLALLTATAIGLVLSLLSLWTGAIPHAGPSITHDGFSGVFSQKNVLGRNIALLALAAVVMSLDYKRGLTGIVVLALLALPMAKTQSVSSLLIYGLVWLVPFIWWSITKKGGLGYLLLFLSGGLLLTVFIVFSTGFNPIEYALAQVGKDSTLTGRTYLWSIGAELFLAAPIIGIGFGAFWDSGIYAEVETIRATFEGQSIGGFHNAIIESLVALGVIGTLLFFISYFSSLWTNVKGLLTVRTPYRLGGTAFLVIAGIAALVDAILFRQHEIFYLLMVCFYGMTIYDVDGPKNQQSSTLEQL